MTGSEQQARVAAGEFRRMHRLGLQPLGDLVALIEQTTGYEVAVLDADYGEHGLTMRDPVRDATFIGVARSRTPMRQRSTLAHELGHLVFGDCDHGVEFAKRSPEEIRADAFARHLLVPVEGVTEFLGQRDGAGMTDLAAVVQRFLVSPAIAAIAMRDAGYDREGVEADHYGPPRDSVRLERLLRITVRQLQPTPLTSVARRTCRQWLRGRGGVGAGDRDFA